MRLRVSPIYRIRLKSLHLCNPFPEAGYRLLHLLDS